jgi:glycosyltransferase involved in cell wall biosynthesis
MVELKKSTGVPLTLAIHDFFPLCPSYNLLNNHGVFCNLPDLAECRKCLPRNTFAEVAAGSNIDRWREQWSSVFSIADKLLCFSENSRTLVNRIYPHCSEKTAVQPHTVKDFPTKRPKLDFSRGLNIGVVGAIGYPKGSKIIIEMAKLIAKKKIPARITVIGTLEGALVPRNITVTGPYKLSELPDLLERHNVNICFLPSICPETFSYVTSELMQLNMPICCFDLGAPAERVQNYELGYIISEINPAAALKEILAFFDKLVIKCRYRE